MSKIASSTIRTAISIPKRIKRSPTDLLKALSDSVYCDPNAPLYKYQDDPFTIPFSYFDKRVYNVSKASGIKAARFMISKYPQAFYKDDCEPHVPAFYPKKEFTNEEELIYPSESLIYSFIEWGKFIDAFNTYQKCKDQKIDVSEACKLALFDVLCIYKNSDLIEKPPPDEEYHSRTHHPVRKFNTTIASNWNDGCPAEVIFNDLKVKSAAVYSSLIKAMILNDDPKKALETYKLMKEMDLKPDVATYNALIDSYAQPIVKAKRNSVTTVIKFLIDMKKNGIKPDLLTFNSVLRVFSLCAPFEPCISLGLSIIQEMKMLKIEPSLATWAYILSIFYPKEGYGFETNILPQVINEVKKMDETNGLSLKDERDMDFFINAIYKCFTAAKDIDDVKQIHSILMKGTNRQFLHSYYAEITYFDKYFQCLFKYALPEYVIQQWELIIPNIFTPLIILVMNMAKYIADFERYEFIPRFWSDIIKLQSLRNAQHDKLIQIIEPILSLMNSYKVSDEHSQNLLKQFGEITRSIITMYPLTPNDMEIKFYWNGKLVGDVIQIFLKIDDFLTAWYVFDASMDQKYRHYESLSEQTFLDLFEYCLKKQKIDEAIQVLTVSSYLEHPSCIECINKLNENVELNQNQKKSLVKLKSRFVAMKNIDDLKLL